MSADYYDTNTQHDSECNECRHNERKIKSLQSENTRLREQLAEKDKEILVIESLQRSDLPIFYNQAILEVVSVLKGKPVGYAKETLKS